MPPISSRRLCACGGPASAVAGSRRSRRVRPVVMLSATTAFGLVPIMWSTGTGADVMKRIAAPMLGGVVTTAVVVLLLFPDVYCVRRGWGLRRT